METLTVQRDLMPYPSMGRLADQIWGIPVRKELSPSDHAVAEVRDDAGTLLGYITKADADAYANRPTLTEVQQMVERLNLRLQAAHNPKESRAN